MELYTALIYHVHLAYYMHKTAKRIHDEAIDCVMSMYLISNRG